MNCVRDGVRDIKPDWMKKRPFWTLLEFRLIVWVKWIFLVWILRGHQLLRYLKVAFGPLFVGLVGTCTFQKRTVCQTNAGEASKCVVAVFGCTAASSVTRSALIHICIKTHTPVCYDKWLQAHLVTKSYARTAMWCIETNFPLLKRLFIPHRIGCET